MGYNGNNDGIVSNGSENDSEREFELEVNIAQSHLTAREESEAEVKDTFVNTELEGSDKINQPLDSGIIETKELVMKVAEESVDADVSSLSSTTPNVIEDVFKCKLMGNVCIWIT